MPHADHTPYNALMHPRDMQRVALISAVAPFPADSGKKIVLGGFLHYLRARLGADNVHYILVGGEADASTTFPVRLHTVMRPGTGEQLVNVAARTLTGRSSLQEALLRGRHTAKELKTVLAGIDPDLLIFDTTRMAQYAPGLPVPVGQRRVCYLDDLFSERYRGMLAATQNFSDVAIDPLGAFVSMVPRAARPLARWPPTQRAILSMESRLVARSEMRAAKAFDSCLLINPNEAALLASRCASCDVQAVPPMVAPPTAVPRRFDGRPRLLTMGWWSLAHNDDGLRWFIRSVLPLVRTRLPDVVLTVVGRGAGEEVKKLSEAAGGSVRLAGFVNDIDDLFASACALVNPLRFGSGIKLKVLDSLARGLPVVSTSVGADGIIDGKEQGVVVADSEEQMAGALVALVDPTRNREVSEQAALHYRNTFSPKAVFTRYDELFNLRDAGSSV